LTDSAPAPLAGLTGLLTTPQVKQLTGLTGKFLIEHSATDGSGEIPGFKIGGTWFFPCAWVLARLLGAAFARIYQQALLAAAFAGAGLDSPPAPAELAEAGAVA
jgi:hypothetical protein